MALDAFIQFDGIPGESLDDQHKNWIEILGYNSAPIKARRRLPVRQAVLRQAGPLLPPSTSPNSSTLPVRSFCRQAVQASTFQR